MKVGNFSKLDTNKIGPLAKPPVPITKFGLNFRIITTDWIKLINNLKGNNILEKENFLFNPEIFNPLILYPRSGTIFISILFFEPTKSNSLLMNLFFKPSAILKAG